MAVIPVRVQNILFDLGGVLLPVDYYRTEQAFRRLGFGDFNQIYSQAGQSEIFDRFEKGQISSEVFLDNLYNMFPVKPQKSKIIQAWNAMLGDFPEDHLELLRTLRYNFDIYLLSNTNEIHFEALNNSIEKQYKLKFSTLFNHAYYSHQMGMRKPDKEVFNHVFTNSSLSAENTVFIDDSIQHIEGAIKAGYQAFHLKAGMQIEELLLSLGILT